MLRLKVLSRASAASIALAAGTLLATPAIAQQPAQPPAQGSGTIGSPSIGDFQLTPRQRIVTQPAPTPAQPTATPAQPSAPRTQPQPTGERARPAAPVREPAPQQRVGTPDAAPAPSAAPADTQAPPVAAPTTTLPASTPESAPAPAEPAKENAAPKSGPLGDGEGVPMWMILLGGLGLGVLGYMIFTRRRAAQRRQLALPAPEPVAAKPVPTAPRAPRPDPVPRPWLEIEFTPERTTADPDESIVEFEMCIRNSGGSTARDIRLQAKLICSTPDQDKEIAAFHRKKPGEHRTLEIPDIPAGKELRLKGRVDAKGDDLKAMRMQQRLLFVPLVAVNAFYDWGTARSGQTSKSFLVGQEKHERDEKMAPFRLDLGPRVYRTVGQRPYKIERRV